MQRPLILLVDDSEDLRETLGMILQARGFDVILACDGRDAFERVQHGGRCPAAIVLDLDMPVMNGSAFLARKPSEPLLAKAPVIIATAAPTPMGSFPPCVRAVLLKPAPLVVLLAALKSACGWARLPAPPDVLANGTRS